MVALPNNPSQAEVLRALSHGQKSLRVGTKHNNSLLWLMARPSVTLVTFTLVLVKRLGSDNECQEPPRGMWRPAASRFKRLLGRWS